MRIARRAWNKSPNNGADIGGRTTYSAYRKRCRCTMRRSRIVDYDQEMLRQLAAIEREECRGQQAPKLKNVNKAQKIKSRGEQTMRQALYRMSGVDATAIDAIGVGTIQVILSEYGPDLSRFATEKQFV